MMKDHEIRELVDTLTSIGKAYGDTQQLRKRIHEVIVPKLKELQKLNAIIEAHPEFQLMLRVTSRIEMNKSSQQKNET